MDRYFRLVDNGVEATFASHEVAFLSDLPRVLARLGDPGDDPGAARLNPPVYLGDPESEEEWRRFAGGELEASRRADRSAFEMVVDALAEQDADPAAVVISDEEAGAFMRVANEVRLVLGARWGIDGPDDYDRLRSEAGAVLGFLGWVVSEMAEVLGQALDRG
jgi:hypothetical protein